MLGFEPTSPAASFANELFDGTWTDPAIWPSGHEGHARDWFHALLDRETPPALIDGSRGRAAEIITWFNWKIFQFEQRIAELQTSHEISRG